MRRTFPAAFLLLPTLLLAPAGAVTVTLEARTAVSDGGLLSTVNPQVMYSGRSSAAAVEFERLVKKEPEYRGALPCRGVLKVGDGQLLVALDSWQLKGGYDTLYVDFNRNLDLTDDEPIHLAQPDARVFPPVAIKVGEGSDAFTWAFTAYAYQRNLAGQRSYGHAQFRASTYREGSVELDGKTVRIVLLDYNSNGRYDDATTVDPAGVASTGLLYARTGDHLLIDPDDEPPVYRYYYMTSLLARHPISRLACIGGKFYQCSVAPSGATVEFEPVECPMGSLAFDAPSWQALLLGEAGVVKVVGERGRPAPLPAGEWKLVEYTAYYGPREARNAEDLTLVAARGAVDAPAIVVEAGKSTSAPWGPPYRLGVVAAPVPQGSTCELSLRITGRAGEVCNNLLLKGERPGPPTFVIAAPDGRKVESGVFEYG